jgi:hypothetical protein
MSFEFRAANLRLPNFGKLFLILME